jgi:hypothetical protein
MNADQTLNGRKRVVQQFEEYPYRPSGQRRNTINDTDPVRLDVVHNVASVAVWVRAGPLWTGPTVRLFERFFGQLIGDVFFHPRVSLIQRQFTHDRLVQTRDQRIEHHTVVFVPLQIKRD